MSSANLAVIDARLKKPERPAEPDSALSKLTGRWRSGFPDAVLLLALVGLGLVLRTIGLGWESIWYDEACSLAMAEASFRDLLTGDKLDVGNPCGYFVLLRCWCLAFGFTIESARAFSGVTDIGSIVMTWMLSMAITKDRRIATTATLLVAINPALIFLAREARVFGLLSTLITMTAWLTERVLRDGKRRDWIALAACCVVLPHLHYYTLFVLVSLWIPLVFGRPDGRWKRLGGYVAMGIISAACFLPWAPNFLNQLTLWTAPYNPWMKHAAYFPVFVFAGRTLIWKQDGLMMMALAQIVVVSGIYAPTMFSIRRLASTLRVPLGIAGGVIVLAAVVSIFYDSLLNSRYLSPIIPALMVAWSVAIWKIPDRLRWVRVLAIGLAFVVAAASLGRMYRFNHKHDWRAIATMIAQRGDDLPVAFYDDIGEESFLYYRPEHPTHRLIDRFGDQGQGWDRAGVEQTLRDGGDFWFCLWTLDDWESIETWMETRFDRVDAADFGEVQLRRYAIRSPAQR